GRTILRNRALGQVHVDVDLLVEVLVEAERRGASARVRQRRLPRFAHRLAQFARQEQRAGSRHHADFHGQHIAAGIGPRETGRHTDTRPTLDLAVEVLRHAEVLVHARLRDVERTRLVERGLLARDLAADGRDLALQTPDARLARVLVDDRAQRLVADPEIRQLEPVREAFFGNQELFRDLDLLVLEIAREPD